MTQHNLTQILKVIRDFVMRNRPCYRDYLGSETVTKTVQIGSGTFVDNEGKAITEFLATDSAFAGFVPRAEYDRRRLAAVNGRCVFSGAQRHLSFDQVQL